MQTGTVVRVAPVPRPQSNSSQAATTIPPPPARPPAQGSLAVFFRSLAVMFASGVTIDRALTLLSQQQADDPRMAQVADNLAYLVRHGHSISGAMSRYPTVFSKMHFKLVQVGEATGNLEVILDQLSQYEEKRQAMTMKVKSALTYPAFLFGACCLMLFILPPFMLGGIFEFIKSSGAELPLVSKIVLGAAMWMRTPAFYVCLALVLAGGFYAVRTVLTRPTLRLKLQRMALDTPHLGPMVRALGVGRFARAWSIQVTVGVAPVAALQLAAEASNDPCLETDIQASTANLRDGVSLEESLKAADYFPSLFVQMVAVGEESGSLDAMVARVALIYEQQVEHTLETLTALLEPMVMVVMGAIVGLIVVATMLPMMQVLQAMG
ncbi:MAG: type II secretion system F family protein [Candidatus Eremiobacterota bacterium]